MANAQHRTDEEQEPMLEAQYIPGGSGHVMIGDDVISRIVAFAIEDVKGVSRDSRTSIAEKIGIADFIGRRGEAKQAAEEAPRRDREYEKGILIERDPEKNSVGVTLSVRMDYGRDMYELAVDLRDHVKKTVENMTHVIVDRVDVRIVGINPREKDKKEAEKPAEAEDAEK